MEFLLIWLGFAVVTAIAASARNHSPGLWFVLGLVGGVFALIAVLVMRPGDEGASGAGNVPSGWSPRANAGPDGPVIASHKGVMIYHNHAMFWAMGQTFATIDDAKAHIDASVS